MVSRVTGALRRQVIGVIALFVALGGTSYSALKPGTVDTRAIKNGAVTTKDIRNKNVRTRDLAPASVTTNRLANGAVTGEKIAAAAVTGDKIGASAVTGEHVAEDSLTGADIADGPGSGLNADLLDGADRGDLQARTSGACAAGEFLRAIAPDGSTACGADADSGGDITGVTAGTGLAGGASSGAATLSLAPNGVTGTEIASDAVTGTDVDDGSLRAEDIAAGEVQRPLSSACAAGQVLRSFGSDGSPTCVTDANSGGDITAVTAGTGLTGGASAGAATLGIGLPLGLATNSSSPLATFTQNGTGSALSLAKGSSGSPLLDVNSTGASSGIRSKSVGNGVDAETTSISSAALIGRSSSGEVIVGLANGIDCEASPGKCSGIGAVVGRHDGPLGYGVRGFQTDSLGGVGVFGQAGVSGGKGVALRGSNINAANPSNAVEGITNGAGAAIYGSGSLAGRFDGAVTINGNLTVTGSKSGFLIDDPRDPEGAVLAHTPVESDEFTVTYSGNVRTDENGEATVRLPGYAEAIAGDWRYNLTPIGVFAQAIVGEEVEDGSFVVRTDQPSVEVSWVLIGTRRDPFAERYPFRAERAKAAGERGQYHHPALYGESGALAIAEPPRLSSPASRGTLSAGSGASP